MTPPLDPEIRARIKEAKRTRARLRERLVAEDRLVGASRRRARRAFRARSRGSRHNHWGASTARYAPGRKSSRWRAQVYL